MKNPLKITTNKCIEKFRKIHGDKYDYSKVDYKGWNDKVLVMCYKHGEFNQTPNNHLNGRGCPKCKTDLTRIRCSKGINKFIEEAKKIHGNKYDYSKFEYNGIKTKGIIICPKHREFLQTAESHLRGHGCSKCNSSHGEAKILYFLENNNIEYISQKTFDGCKGNKGWLLRFDFYIPSKNLLIEFDGEQHFRKILLAGKRMLTNEQLKYIQFKDSIKNQYAKNNNIKLLRINYTQINKIDDILKLVL